MLTIDRLRLHLPPEYKERARHISRLAAEELAGIKFSHTEKIESINISPVKIMHGMADLQVARQIAVSVEKQLNSRRTTGV